VIAESVSRYPTGGPDPLEQAWEVTNSGVYKSKYERFIALFNPDSTAGLAGSPTARTHR
jgi:hypothetical protein